MEQLAIEIIKIPVTLSKDKSHKYDRLSDPYKTNAPINKYLNLLKNLVESEINLLLPIDKIIKIFRFIKNQYYFTFDNDLYRQKFRLLMESPLSSVLSCLLL